MSVERLKQRLKVELGLESSRLFTLNLYGTAITFGEPLFKQIAALQHWLDIPRIYRRFSVYVYAIDNDPIPPSDYLRRYSLCCELMKIPPILIHFISTRLERIFPFVDYGKLSECEDVFTPYMEIDPPSQTEELFLRYISQLREKTWYDRFRLLKKALGILTTSEDLASQVQESYIIDPHNPNVEPHRRKVNAIEIPLLLGIKPELEKVLKSRIHVDTNYQHIPSAVYQETKDGQRLPLVDMTSMSRDEFLQTFWNSPKGYHQSAPIEIAPTIEHDTHS